MIPKCCSPRPSRASRNRTRPRRGSTSRRVSSSIPRTSPSPLAWLAWRRRKDTSIGPRPSCGKRFRPIPPLDLAFELAETLILQDKIEGKDEAGDYIARLRSAGLWRHPRPVPGSRDSCFSGRSGPRRSPGSRWPGRSWSSDPQLTAQLNLMLAECYGRWVPRSNGWMPSGGLPKATQARNGPGSSSLRPWPDRASSTRRSRSSAAGGAQPEWRLDLVRLLIQKTIAAPRDQRNWGEVEQQLASRPRRQLPEGRRALALLRVDMLAAQDRLEDARCSCLGPGQGPPQPPVSARTGPTRPEEATVRLALQILDQAEKDLDRARISNWLAWTLGRQGGNEAKAAVAKLAETLDTVPLPISPDFLDRLAAEPSCGSASRPWPASTGSSY